MTVTEKLANFIAKTDIGDMPSEVVLLTKRAIIDTLGVALAGSVQPVGKTITAFVNEFGCQPVAGVIGDKVRTSSPLAAMANGTIAHLLDYDDCAEAGVQGHPSVVLVSVVLALGEELKASGKEIIAAYVLGFETWARISSMVPQLHLKGWHPTSVLGTVGGAAAAAKLLKLTPEQTAITLGIACSESAGLIHNFGTTTKPLHAGNAARNAIIAALLAKRGFTASPNIMEGEGNFPVTFYGSGVGNASKVIEKLGASYALISHGIGVKKYPNCYATHRPLDAVLHLIELHDIKPEEVEAVKVVSTPIAESVLIHSDPSTALAGKFSMQFAMAVALTDRRLGLEQVTDKKVNDPVIKSLMKKVTLSVHPDWVQGKDIVDTRADIVTVRLKNGKEYSEEVLVAKGGAQSPLEEEELLAKYRDCAKLALNERAVEQCLELVWQIEKLGDIRELMRVLAG